MSEVEKIPTEKKSYRLASDVLEMLERWAEESGETPAQVIMALVRQSDEDRRKVSDKLGMSDSKASDNGELSDTSVGQWDSSGDPEKAGMEIIGICERRQMDADGVARALGIARSYFNRRTEGYASMKPLRDEGKLPTSVYELDKYRVGGKLP